MKTNQLTNALLDYWVARALGVPARELTVEGVPRTANSICVRTRPPHSPAPISASEVLDYSTNWALTGPLIESQNIGLLQYQEGWVAGRKSVGFSGMLPGPTPLVAACRSIVGDVFGGEVEDWICAQSL